MKFTRFRLAFWRWDIGVLVGGTPRDAAHFGHKTLGVIDDDVDDTAEGYCWVKANAPILIWVESLNAPELLAHECLHAICGVMKHRGVWLDDSSEEVYTYGLGGLMRQIYDTRDWQSAPALLKKLAKQKRRG